MKKTLYATTAASALALALTFNAVPTKADVFVTVDFDKVKDILVLEYIYKVKYVFIEVTTELDLDGAAEAMAVVNATNELNLVDGAGDAFQNPLADFDLFLNAAITGSINDNTGIVGVNQDVGNMVNQGNVVALSVTGREPGEGEEVGDTSDSSLTHSQAEVEQLNTANIVFDSEFLDVPGDPEASTPNKTALIENSINNNAGIVGVNQNAGNMNNQHNVVAMAVGFESFIALSEAALGQSNTFNTVEEIETIKIGEITGSINFNSGVVGVNQSTGNMNNQASVVSFSALTSNASIGVPGS